jgi:hypothetical protein
VDARHAATYKVAAQILYQYWKNNGEAFTLGNSALNGVSRWQKSRALAELEAFGLIRRTTQAQVTASHRRRLNLLHPRTCGCCTSAPDFTNLLHQRTYGPLLFLCLFVLLFLK